MSKQNKQEKREFNETNIYRVRRSTRLNEGLFLCKVIMKKHGSVQIEGMGECISLVTKFAQILSKNGIANIAKIGSEDLKSERSRAINPKLTINLDKGPKFDELTANIEPKK